jgi:hypothetical protein
MHYKFAIKNKNKNTATQYKKTVIVFRPCPSNSPFLAVPAVSERKIKASAGGLYLNVWYYIPGSKRSMAGIRLPTGGVWVTPTWNRNAQRTARSARNSEAVGMAGMSRVGLAHTG